MSIKPANTKTKYVAFMNELNLALERLHNRAQAEMTDVMRGAFTRVLEIIAFRYSSIGKDNLLSSRSKQIFQNIDHELDRLFQHVGQKLLSIQIDLGRKAYTLSYVGSTEAIGRAMNEPMRFGLPKGQGLKGTNLRGENPASRIALGLDRVRRKVMDALELALVQELSVEEVLLKVLKALPKKRVYKKPPRALKRLIREADKEKPLPFSFGFVDEKEWAEIVNDYMNEYIPQSRGPETVFDLPDPEGGPDLEERYGWELEQELTDDFVSQVRSGQNDSAEKLGITDFVWIAIIDDRTCQKCCAWRSGLTSREIEQKLAKEHQGDECEAIVPPAHENCRCDMAPMLKDMPEVEPSNLQEFEEWLNS